jgi:hypothetical protein
MQFKDAAYEVLKEAGKLRMPPWGLCSLWIPYSTQSLPMTPIFASGF